MQGKSVSPLISSCTPEDFSLVKKYIAEFFLDDNDLRPEQFLVSKTENQIVGFGRLRNYQGCSELCSLGVLETFRRRGVGSALCEALIKKSVGPLYTVTIIPGFFERLGFAFSRQFPDEIKTKFDYCKSSLPVPETYVVMRYF